MKWGEGTTVFGNGIPTVGAYTQFDSSNVKGRKEAAFSWDLAAYRRTNFLVFPCSRLCPYCKMVLSPNCRIIDSNVLTWTQVNASVSSDCAHVCVCTHVCVCVLIPSLSAPSLVLHAFQKEQAPDSPLAACTGQGVVENLLYSISEPAEFSEQKVFYAKNQVLRCKDVLWTTVCPLLLLGGNHVLTLPWIVSSSIIGTSLWRQMSTVILPPLLFIPKPLRTNRNRPYVRLAGRWGVKHSPCFQGDYNFSS